MKSNKCRLLDGKSPQTNGSGVPEKSVSTEIGVPKSNSPKFVSESKPVRLAGCKTRRPGDKSDTIGFDIKTTYFSIP